MLMLSESTLALTTLIPAHNPPTCQEWLLVLVLEVQGLAAFTVNTEHIRPFVPICIWELLLLVLLLGKRTWPTTSLGASRGWGQRPIQGDHACQHIQGCQQH
jgi:hypothetical protein